MLTLSGVSRERLEAAEARACKLVNDKFGGEIRLSASVREDAVLANKGGPSHLASYVMSRADGKPLSWAEQNAVEELIDRAHDYVSHHLPFATA